MLTTSVNRSRLSRTGKLIVSAVALCLLLPLAAIRVPAQNQSDENAAVPRGWVLAGTHPANFLSGVDRESLYLGRPSAYLRAKPSATEGFGTLMQSFSATQYAGQRVRLSAAVKSEVVTEQAGLWMRVDKGKEVVAFGNMQTRPIKGTTDWQYYSVVLDVPKDATGISFGILLDKSGTVWLNKVRFESVGIDVPTTDITSKPREIPDGPTNLDFEN